MKLALLCLLPFTLLGLYVSAWFVYWHLPAPWGGRYSTRWRHRG